MRPRYNSDGTIKGFHNMMFDDIPDDYEIKKVILDDKVYDLSYIGVVKYLRDNGIVDEFQDDTNYSLEVISSLALDYLKSAIFLQKGIIEDRGNDMVSHYLIPCTFSCKHAVELKLKECLIAKGEKNFKGHSVLTLWNKLNEINLPQINKIKCFIEEIEKIDNNEMALRYGISKRLEPLQEKFKFDVYNLISNSKFLFNVLDEYAIYKYKFGDDKNDY